MQMIHIWPNRRFPARGAMPQETGVPWGWLNGGTNKRPRTSLRP